MKKSKKVVEYELSQLLDFQKGFFIMIRDVLKRWFGKDAFLGKGGGRYALKGDLREKIRAYTKTVYKRLDLKGVVRMDFLVSADRAYLCEVNTVPGSLAYYLFCERVSDARSFFSDLIEDAIAQGKTEKRLITTGILRSVKWQGK